MKKLLALLLILAVPTALAVEPVAKRIQTDTTNFDGVLSAADTDVQKALETLDAASPDLSAYLTSATASSTYLSLTQLFGSEQTTSGRFKFPYIYVPYASLVVPPVSTVTVTESSTDGFFLNGDTISVQVRTYKTMYDGTKIWSEELESNTYTVVNKHDPLITVTLPSGVDGWGFWEKATGSLLLNYELGQIINLSKTGGGTAGNTAVPTSCLSGTFSSGLSYTLPSSALTENYSSGITLAGSNTLDNTPIDLGYSGSGYQFRYIGSGTGDTRYLDIYNETGGNRLIRLHQSTGVVDFLSATAQDVTAWDVTANYGTVTVDPPTSATISNVSAPTTYNSGTIFMNGDNFQMRIYAWKYAPNGGKVYSATYAETNTLSYSGYTNTWIKLSFTPPASCDGYKILTKGKTMGYSWSWDRLHQTRPYTTEPYPKTSYPLSGTSDLYFADLSGYQGIADATVTPTTYTGGFTSSAFTASKPLFTDADKKITTTGTGTSSQFIKGDGSLDSSTYLTEEVDGSTTNEIEVVDEAYNATNFNGGTTSAVSQDDFYDYQHTGDTDDDALVDKVDLSSSGFVKTNASGVLSTDSNTYLTSLSGALLATGNTQGATAQAQPFTLGIKILEGGSSPTKYATLLAGDQTADLTFTLPTAYPASTAFLKIGTGGSLTTDTNTYLTAEADPKVGTLTNTKWCTSDGSVVNCTEDEPAGGGGGGWTDETTYTDLTSDYGILAEGSAVNAADYCALMDVSTCETAGCVWDAELEACNENTSGTYWEPPDGAGERFFWWPRRGALRAGKWADMTDAPTYGTDGSSWADPENVGLYSVAFGKNVKASGRISFALGFNQRATNVASVAIGGNSVVSSQYGVSLGLLNNVTGDGGIGAGTGNAVSGPGAVGMGYGSQSSGIATVALGSIANASGIGSVAIGANVTSSGVGAVCLGAANVCVGTGSFSAGQENTTAETAGFSSVIGYQNDAEAGGIASFLAGEGNTSSAHGCSAIGQRNTCSANAANAFGFATVASAKDAFSANNQTTASGESSASFGEATTSSGKSSFSWGSSGTASGKFSTTAGRDCTVSGDNSMCFNLGTDVESCYGDNTYDACPSHETEGACEADYLCNWADGACEIAACSTFAGAQCTEAAPYGCAWGFPPITATVSSNGRFIINEALVGINTTSPAKALEVKDDDIYINKTSGNLILKSPDGSCSSCGVDNSDNWSCSGVTCP